MAKRTSTRAKPSTKPKAESKADEELRIIQEQIDARKAAEEKRQKEDEAARRKQLKANQESAKARAERLRQQHQRPKGNEPLAIEYDKAKDVVTINGVAYSGQIFRTMAMPNAAAMYRLRTKPWIDGLVMVELTAFQDRDILEAIERGNEATKRALGLIQ